MYIKLKLTNNGDTDVGIRPFNGGITINISHLEIEDESKEEWENGLVDLLKEYFTFEVDTKVEIVQNQKQKPIAKFKEFGDFLRKKHEATGLTLNEVTNFLSEGMMPQNMIAYFSGRVLPAEKHLSKLAQIYKIDHEYLLDWSRKLREQSFKARKMARQTRPKK